ncbi:MAG: NfeD family protein [Thermoplasmata archaeon]|nr:NfeD family protein [Thermoplasmata archaeon]
MAVDIAIGVVLILGGIILFTLELIHPGALLLIPGSILLVSGALYLLFPDILLDSFYGPALILLAVVVAIAVEIPYYRWVAPQHRPLSTTSSGLVGEIGIVTAPVEPNTLKGKIRIKSQIWSARSEVPIPIGVHVQVIHGEGVSVTVKAVEAGTPV